MVALATSAPVLGGLAVPSLASPAALGTSSVGADTETVCACTRGGPRTGERDGVCVWIPDVLPPTPPPAG